MKNKRFGWKIITRTALVFLTMFLAALAILNGWYMAGFVLVPAIIYQFYDYYNYHRKAQSEVEQFVESVHYRDFSRYFDVNRAPAELQPFRTGFNQINSTFKIISREKETQYLHIKSILEIIDTGIISYDIDSGDILWMNESLKSLLQIPYLKTIHSLEKRRPALYAEIVKLNAGQNTVTGISTGQSQARVLLSATLFKNDDKTFKLIAIQNINEALDEGESQAWQKLLSVMTHEIMNSVAPITSLAETIRNRVQESAAGLQDYKEAMGDIETGIETIRKRSEGLLRFTETYRNLSRITRADVGHVLIIEMLEQVQQLMQPTLDKRAISLEIVLRDPFLSLEADPALIEQVLINLLLNAIDAVKDTARPRIVIAAEARPGGKVSVSVHDNGAGIPPELLEKIFIPFFSTKKAGSGIGLSLCRQVMLLHKGQVQVQSKEGEGTVFTLLFN